MVALPYYTGLIAHRPGGPVANFHPAAASFPEFIARLAAFKPPLLSQPVLVVLWVCYAAATMALVVIGFAAARRELPSKP
jgi:hypothetical protein